MRTTLDIEDDVLSAVKEISRQRKVSIGKALSDLVRQALTRKTSETMRHGVPQFPVQPDAEVVSLKLVNKLRDED